MNLANFLYAQIIVNVFHFMYRLSYSSTLVDCLHATSQNVESFNYYYS